MSERDALDLRPTAEEMLARIGESERAGRGRLRVYLGMAPGVGKTYRMLEEGHRRKARGTDVVVGFVEAHGRANTAALVEGLEVVPRRRISYRDVVVEEMDADAVIARHPTVALIDELAHTNAPGSPVEKRWEDVERIRDAGIHVITTLNVQHLDSVADAVETITGAPVHERLPDDVLEQADEIELVDMSPHALRQRMRHGNVYPPERTSGRAGPLLHGAEPDGAPRHRPALHRAPRGGPARALRDRRPPGHDAPDGRAGPRGPRRVGGGCGGGPQRGVAGGAPPRRAAGRDPRGPRPGGHPRRGREPPRGCRRRGRPRRGDRPGGGRRHGGRGRATGRGTRRDARRDRPPAAGAPGAAAAPVRSPRRCWTCSRAWRSTWWARATGQTLAGIAADRTRPGRKP